MSEPTKEGYHDVLAEAVEQQAEAGRRSLVGEMTEAMGMVWSDEALTWVSRD